MAVLKQISLPSPAKLNLFLYINNKRPDGYHELQTLFQFLDYSDTLHFEITDSGEITLLTEMVGVTPEQNLIYRAAKLLQEQTACPLGVNIRWQKRLPMGGGIGGGSSNAATVLVALNHFWQTGLSLDELAALGLKLGADVPVFVRGEAALAEGVGEKFTHCLPEEKWYVVLVPNVSISTAAIFAHPELPRNTPKRTVNALLSEAWENDCEKIVRKLYPEVDECLSWLLQYAPARLTGTGACVFAEFDSRAKAQLVFAQKPAAFQGFIAQGKNHSPLHQQLFFIS